jgi:translation initiation factor IF-2
MLPPGSGKGRGGDAHRGNGNKGGGAGGAANGGAAAGGPAGGPADDPLAELSAASLRPVPSGTPAGGSSASRPAAGLNSSTKIRLPGSTVRSGSGITRPAGGTHRMGSSAGHMTAAGGGGRPAGRPGRGGKGGGMPMGLVAAAAFGALVLGIAVWALLLRQPRRDPVQKDKERPAVKETESFNNAPPPD